MSRKIVDYGELDIVQFASWMNVDDTWLRHVIEYSFGYGCSSDPESGNPHCAIWNALQERLRAQENLSRAEKEYEIAVQQNRGISL
jgi:hypothetical protein